MICFNSEEGLYVERIGLLPTTMKKQLLTADGRKKEKKERRRINTLTIRLIIIIIMIIIKTATKFVIKCGMINR